MAALWMHVLYLRYDCHRPHGKRSDWWCQAAEGLDVEDVNAHLTSLDGKEMLAKLRREVQCTTLAVSLHPMLVAHVHAHISAALGCPFGIAWPDRLEYEMH